MFIQEHHVCMQMYYEHVKHMNQNSTHGFDYGIASVKKAYLLRIAATVDAFKIAIVGLVIQTTKGLNELVIGIIHFDTDSFKNSGHYFSGALIDSIASSIIGIIGVIFPVVAFTLTEKTSKFASQIISKKTENDYRTTSFNEITARLICPLRGATDALAEGLEAISQLITKILTLPAGTKDNLIHDIFLPNIKGSQRQFLYDSKNLSDATLKLIAGATGLIFVESRTYLDIYP